MLYLLSSLPVLASYHYCLGRVKQISFYETAVPDCVCPSPEEVGDCCDDDRELIDFQDDHAGSSHQLLVAFAAYAVELPSCFKLEADLEQQLGLPLAHAPPLLPAAQPLFIQHQAFLI